MPGCWLEVRDDAAQFVPNAGTFTASSGIPTQPALAGAQVFSQAFVFEPLRPAGLGVTSRALHAVLGR